MNLPPELTNAIITLVVGAIIGSSGYVIWRFRHQQDIETEKQAYESRLKKVRADAEDRSLQIKADAEAATLTIKQEAEAQSVKDREALRTILKDYVERVDELSKENRKHYSSLEVLRRDLVEEQNKNARADTRINELVDLRTQDAGKVNGLEAKITQLEREASETSVTIKRLENTLLERTNERDVALAKVIKLNGEIEHRDQQIAQLQKALDEMKAAQEEMQKQIETLQKKDTGKLSPDVVSDSVPSVTLTAPAEIHVISAPPAPMMGEQDTIDTLAKDAK